MARAREVPGFDCDEPFAAAAARVLGSAPARSSSTPEGVLDIGEIERLHDMRVATRRLRAAMEVFEACFPRKRYRKALKQVKTLADALGERRDRDVEIEFLEEFAAEAPAGDRGRLEARIAMLRDEQRGANDDLAPFLAEKRLREAAAPAEKLAKAAEA